MATYRLLRFYQRDDLHAEVLAEGLTLEEVTERCTADNGSSQTCTDPALKKLTKRVGAWFLGRQEEET